MTKNERQTIYRKAIARWGHDAQLGMVVEEAAELIKAVQKLRRAEFGSVERYSRVDELLSEVADVRIMLEQIELMVGESCDGWMQVKLERLRKTLDGGDAA